VPPTNGVQRCISHIIVSEGKKLFYIEIGGRKYYAKFVLLA
jgi:hypothetical protein